MKKPNITTGVWEIKEYGDVIKGVCQNDRMVAVMNVNRSQYKENAKAISAVPDMLDSLIRAYTIIGENSEEEGKAIVMIENALEKAGVEF